MPTSCPPTVSVIIITWNSATYLPQCLAAMRAQTFTDYEIIIVDNGSSDGGIMDLESRYPDLTLQLEQLSSNTGFAVANNIGARLASGRWIALLNADAFPEPDWLEQLLKGAQSFPDGYFFASRQLQVNEPSRLDGEGDVFHISGLAWRNNFGVPIYPAPNFEPVFSACGAAAMYPRQAFLDIGGFDEDYFSYFEDVDMGFRLRLQGYQCVVVSEAIVHHVGSASMQRTSDFTIYHAHRNLEATYLKNMPAILLCLFFPVHLLMNVFYLAFYTLHAHGDAIWRAKRDALLAVPSTLKKRQAIQSRRTAPVWQIYKSMNRSLWGFPRRPSKPSARVMGTELEQE